MQFRFIHAADIHLGYEQYHLTERYNDFARAYFYLVDYAIEQQVDFLLIAGDLFHRANPDALTIYQASHGLQKLQQAGIPVVAVEGNHDAQNYRKQLSWMEYLKNQGLLCLLDADNQNGVRTLVPWDPDAGFGSYIDLAGARIYGLRYYGAATARVLESVREDIEPSDYTILMLHTGLEGQVPHMHGGLKPAEVEPLRDRVNYMAMGHIHKRLMEDDLIFNPGSIETNSFEEMDWPHGFFDVEVRDGVHTVTPVDTPTLRPFRRISVSADEIPTVEEFVAHTEERIAAARGIPEGAVIELSLGGMAEFARQNVPLEQLKAAVESRHHPLTVRVQNRIAPLGTIAVRNAEHMSRDELERTALHHLLYQQAEYRDRAEAWTDLVLDVKKMALESQPGATIADHVKAKLQKLEAQEPESDPAPMEASEEDRKAAI